METTGERDESARPETSAREAEAPEPPQRPRPPRPDVVVSPLRAQRTHPGPVPRTLTAAVTVWAASFAAFAALAAGLAADYDAIVAALAAGLTADDPTTDPSTIDAASGLTVLAVGGVGLLLVLAGVLGLVRLRAGRPARVWLTVVAVLTVAAAVTSWSVLSDAHDLAFHVPTWAPWLQAALVVVGTGLLFTGSESGWLRRRGTP